MGHKEEAVRAAFENLSIQRTQTNTFIPSNQLDRNDAKYAVRLPIALLIEGLDVLSRDMGLTLPASEPVTSARLTQAADILQHAITKFVLFVSREPDATIAAKESDNLSRAITNVVCMLRSLLDTAGATQKEAIIALGTSVLSRLRTAILQLQHMLLSGVELDAHLTGIVWDACKQLPQQTPITNAQAVGKQLMTQMATIKDAKQELSEIKQMTSETGADDDDDEDFDDDDFDEAVELSAEEFQIVPPTIELVSFSFSMTRLIYSLTLKGSKDGETTEIVDWMEIALKNIRSIAQSIDVIGAGIDSADALRSLRPQYIILIQQLQSLVQHIPTHPRFEQIFVSLLDEKDRVERDPPTNFEEQTCSICACSLTADKQKEQFAKPDLRFLNTLVQKVHRIHSDLGIHDDTVSSST